MSTVADVITDLRDDLKDSGGDNFSDAQLMRYMNRFRIYLAAMRFRNQIAAGVKSVNYTAAAGTATYTLPSDFFAEKLINWNQKSKALDKISLDEYISKGLNSATSTGTSDKYMILGDALYFIDPIPGAGTLNFWYYYIDAAFSSTTATMPHGGLLDQCWREFVTKLLLNRDEYNTQYEEFIFKQLEYNVLSALVGRSSSMWMIPDRSANGDPLRDITVDGLDDYTWV